MGVGTHNHDGNSTCMDILRIEKAATWASAESLDYAISQGL